VYVAVCEPEPAGILKGMTPKVGITFCGEQKILSYEAAVLAAGLTPVRLILSNSPHLSDVDGLMLTGGTDVNPRLYGQEAGPETSAPDDDRDAMELDLLREALRNDMPVLAICRGMQLLNVAQGGTLHQHLLSADVHVRRQNDELPGRHRAVHDVVVAQGSKLATIIGAGKHDVNSRHHQAVDRLGSDLNIAAVSIDGVVEAMELPDRKFAIAVQWHPEDRIVVSESDRKLFACFADALRDRPLSNSSGK